MRASEGIPSARRARSKVKSFPRKRESSGRVDSLESSNSGPEGLEESCRAIVDVWIPAFAGMTSVSKGIPFDMTPVPNFG
jgi:hypothetical protein